MKETAQKNDWVRIEQIILTPDQRLKSLPESTRKQPLRCWINGFMINETATIGEEVSIRTNADRIINGKLYEVWPSHNHSFGRQQETLIYVGREMKEMMGE